MINNSIVVALAIISVVCVYLMWENFKIRSKVKYLEASIHETVQTVQAMINSPFQHPPLQSHQQQHQQPQPQTQPQAQPQPQPQTQPQEQSQPQPQQEQKQENKMTGGGAGFFQNIISNIMKTVEQASPMFENCDIESLTDESTTEDDNKIEEIEPLDITDELKKEINDLTFADVEEDNFEPKIEELVDEENVEDLEEVENLEEVDVDNFEPKIEELEDVTTQVEEVTTQEEETTIQVEEVKVKEDEMMNDIEDIGDLEMSTEDPDTYLTNPDVLGYLTLKQLQDIAEKNKLGKRGTKEQLITRIKRNMKLK